MRIRFLSVIVLMIGAIVILSGCGDKQTDPNQPYNEPGYYNGKLDPHGANKGGGKASSAGATAGAPSDSGGK